MRYDRFTRSRHSVLTHFYFAQYAYHLLKNWTQRRLNEAYLLSCDARNDFTLWKEEMRKRAGIGVGIEQEEGFERFKDLPAEIRVLIWGFAVSGEEGRVVELRGGVRRERRGFSLPWGPNSNSASTEGDGGRGRADIWSICAIPALLHTCHESRFEARKAYEYAFDGVWIDFEKDTVFFGRKCNFMTALIVVGKERGFEDLGRVKWLAISMDRSWALITRFIEWELLEGLEGIVVVGERERFELGGRPDLRLKGVGMKEEDVEWEGDGGWTVVCRRGIERRIEEWGMEREKEGRQRKQVVVREGIFVKGIGDRWYCSKRKWK
jgi:hypothetical protein